MLVADRGELLRVDLADGTIVSRLRITPRPAGVVTALAMAQADGAVYATYCGRTGSLPRAELAEIDPSTGRVIAHQYYGTTFYGRYELTAVAGGVWLAAGAGGNGIWLRFYTERDLRLTYSAGGIGNFYLRVAGHLLLETQAGGGLLACFQVGRGGVVRATSSISRAFILYPVGLVDDGEKILGVRSQPAAVLLGQAPRHCADP
ncbi:MAG: hypothetical protein M0Z46_03585 [Actinomycetota bacterium]|nr:hypothetical protein [Actinomycetota bacterium]MDA8309687.1 hypothetical protein [Actinomycetota bacterium]